MINRLKALLILAAIFFSASASFGAIPTQIYFDTRSGKTVEVAAGRILVKFKPAVSASSINSINQIAGASVVTRLPEVGAMEISSGATVDQLLAAYKADPNVEYAEPDFIYPPMSTIPNDTYFSRQWGLVNIKAPQAWDIQKGSASVIIAILDSGVDTTHPDLSTRVYAGHNYIDNNNDVTDLFGHGTHLAGIIGAETDNAVGIAGTTWGCRMMIQKVFDASGGGDTASILAQALIDAANAGARVINMSLGGATYSATFDNAVQYAHGKGCVIVASAGNTGDNTVSYPASFNNVISVAAVDRYDNRAAYSSYNAFVDVCAPGGYDSMHGPGMIYSTTPTYYFTKQASGYYNNYDYMQGTSMAAPFVAGFAGLIFSQNPTWTNTQVENLIISSVDHLGTAGRNDYYGYGRINMYKAFNTTPPSPPATPALTQDRHRITVSLSAGGQQNLEEFLIYRSGSAAGPFSLIGTADASATSYEDDVTQEGTYYYETGLVDAAGLISGLSAAASITVSFSLDDIYIYPNPLTTGTTAEVNFGGLAGDENIRIYTISGQFMASGFPQGQTQWKWNARNFAGNQAARGIYLYLISRPGGQKRVGKIAIL
ncbi:MAG TPA: S8 family peptidase [Candidatus Omnitrophota bacterium]|nr:S8 family peptidase [Candidatus Omnitrophota bacterium]